MLQTVPRPEVTPEKIMKQWYQGKLAERLMQAGAMAKDRALLRRGSRKMQDGTLGQSSDSTAEDDAMNIHIGDVVVSQAEPSPPPATPVVARPNIAPVAGGAGSFLKKALLSAALLALGGGAGSIIPWLAGAFDKPAVQTVVDTDTDTQTTWATDN